VSENTQKEESTFAGFQSEAFDAGEPIEVEAAKEVAKPEAESKVEEALAAKTTEGEAAKPVGEEGEPQTPAGKEGEETPPKKTAQERINEITRARRDAERRAEAAEQRTRELEARLNAPPREEPKKEDLADDPDAPKPDDYEYGELDSRYIRALAEHAADKRFATLRARDEQTQQERAQREKQEKNLEHFETLIERGSKVHDDFYEKVVVGSEKGEWPMSEVIGQMALESDVGNDILYHLATNVEEADRIYRSSPAEQARYFGRMEARFSPAGQAAASGDTGKPAPRTPKAPPPVETARGAGGQFQAGADTEDFAAFEARAKTGR
jgi:hypothetical protein